MFSCHKSYLADTKALVMFFEKWMHQLLADPEHTGSVQEMLSKHRLAAEQHAPVCFNLESLLATLLRKQWQNKKPRMCG